MRDSYTPSWTDNRSANPADRGLQLTPQTTAAPLPEECLSHWGLKKSLEFIHKNYTARLCLDDAAAEACLTRCYYSKLFRQVIGVTFQQYVNRLRIAKAKQLLRSCHWCSISRVAHESGFGTLRNFEVTFKRETGHSPSQYRANGSS